MMKQRVITTALAAVFAGTALLGSTAFAAVGEQVNKSMSQTITPEVPESAPDTLPEAGHAFTKYMRFYVPVQAASGDTTDDEGGDLTVPYNDYEGALVKERPVAKPLISAFIYGPVEELDTSGDTYTNAVGFSGNGYRDAYGAVSLDDGFTWKQTNLSESADTEVTVPASDSSDGMTYPSGDVNNVVHAIAGNRIVVAWQSRICSQGSPAYTLSDTDGSLTEEGQYVADYLLIDQEADLYLRDVFGVAGSQGSVDYTEQGYPSVGEVPYNCLWTARGVLLTDDDEAGVSGDDPRTEDVVENSHVVWYKPERLTSGRRDVNRIEIQMVSGAGAAITWQEDPEGLRPGSGEGPGTGWSGATAASQTDVWYSFLPWEYFEQVQDDENLTTPYEALTDYWGDQEDGSVNTTKPKAYVPFAVPMRLTNNARCNAVTADNLDGDSDLYCNLDDTNPYGLKVQCADTVTVKLGNQQTDTEICVSEDGLPNLANTAAVRARLSLQARDTDGDGETDSAWAIVVAEEDKGLGKFLFNDDGTTCEVEDETCQVADIGKNVWYYSFDMGDPQTSADLSETGLVKNLVSQGNILNQPEVDWETGETYPVLNTSLMWEFGDYDFDIYRTEIARRGSLMVQPLSNVASSGLKAMLLFKQGLLNQGGPADIMARRLVYTGSESENPYDFSNIDCDTWGEPSAYYPKGICLDPAINLSAVTPSECAILGGDDNDDSVDASDGNCPTLDESGILSEDPADQTAFDKVTTWYQCPGAEECDGTELLGSNLDDQSWYNPLDVAKGHRGFLWGDMAVVMYAWSPNWKLNAKGSDHYELYIRRSFDGGKTWTTTPGDWGGLGATTCEYMRDGDTSSESTQVCTDYAAGDPEQARNVSQLAGGADVDQDGVPDPTNKYTVLDPRYAPDPPTMPTIESDYYDPDSDEFNPTRFFVVFEIGDNTTVTEGEAEPLDMSYSRAINFGDYYQAVQLAAGDPDTVESNDDEVDLIGACAPGTFCNQFDRLNVGTTSGSEASLAMTPAGDLLYAVWSSHNESTGESDAQYARVWYDDEYIAWSIPDDSMPGADPCVGDECDTDDGDGGDNGDGGDDGDNGGGGSSGGCSVAAGGNAGIDPLFPAVVLGALGYLGLRRRMARVSR